MRKHTTCDGNYSGSNVLAEEAAVRAQAEGSHNHPGTADRACKEKLRGLAQHHRDLQAAERQEMVDYKAKSSNEASAASEVARARGCIGCMGPSGARMR